MSVGTVVGGHSADLSAARRALLHLRASTPATTARARPNSRIERKEANGRHARQNASAKAARRPREAGHDAHCAGVVERSSCCPPAATSCRTRPPFYRVKRRHDAHRRWRHSCEPDGHVGCAARRGDAVSSTPSTRRDAGIWGLNHCFVALLKVAAFVPGVRSARAKDKEQLKKLWVLTAATTAYVAKWNNDVADYGGDREAMLRRRLRTRAPCTPRLRRHRRELTGTEGATFRLRPPARQPRPFAVRSSGERLAAQRLAGLALGEHGAGDAEHREPAVGELGVERVALVSGSSPRRAEEAAAVVARVVVRGPPRELDEAAEREDRARPAAGIEKKPRGVRTSENLRSADLER